MSEETKNTAQEEETTDTPVTEETVENEPEVVENGEAEAEEIPVEDGDEEASQDDKKESKNLGRTTSSRGLSTINFVDAI